MVLTMCGCLLLFCSVLAFCLFCWLSYASLSDTRTSRSGKSQRGPDGASSLSQAETKGAPIPG
jgi:hypothetical protein